MLLNRIDGGGPLDLVIEEGIGPVRCTTVPIDGERGRARFQLPQLPEETGQAADKETIAAALALSPDDIGFEGSQPSFWSAGISFAFVPVRGREAIRRCQPRLEYWDAAFTRSGLCLLR